MATTMNSGNFSHLKQVHANIASLWEVMNTLAGNQDEGETGTYREMELTIKLQQAVKGLKPGLKRVLTTTAALVEHHTGEKLPIPGESQSKGKKKQQQKQTPNKTHPTTPTHEDLSDYDEDDEAGEDSDLIIDEDGDEENEEQEVEEQPETPESTLAMHPSVKNPQTVPMAAGMSPMDQIMQLQTAPPTHPYPHPPPSKARVAHQPKWTGPQTPASQPTADWWSANKGKFKYSKKRPNTTRAQVPTIKKGKKQQQQG